MELIEWRTLIYGWPRVWFPDAVQLGQLEQVAQLLEPGLHLIPAWVRAVAEHSTLGFVFGPYDCRQFWGREQRFAIGKAHIHREEVAAGEMSAADPVIVGLDGRIFVAS